VLLRDPTNPPAPAATRALRRRDPWERWFELPRAPGGSQPAPPCHLCLCVPGTLLELSSNSLCSASRKPAS